MLKGKQFFYDAQDVRDSRATSISAAPPVTTTAVNDGRVWDLTGFGEGLRNTINLRGRAGAQGQGFLHWSANFDEVQDFEGQIRNLSGGAGLMTNTDFNTGTRSQPLGDPKSGISADLDALAAYVTSLNTFARSPLRNSDGTLTTDALAGKQSVQRLELRTMPQRHGIHRQWRSDAAQYRHDQAEQWHATRRARSRASTRRPCAMCGRLLRICMTAQPRRWA